MVAAFAGLGWWQAGRAADGNTLSWAYTFEWPLFAIFVIVLWIREMRQTLRAGRPEARAGGESHRAEDGRADQPVADQSAVRVQRPVITRRVRHATSEPDDDSDPQLAEYNRYLAWLNEHPEAKPSDYPAKELR